MTERGRRAASSQPDTGARGRSSIRLDGVGSAVVHRMQRLPRMKYFATSTAAILLICGACAERAQFQPIQNTSQVSPSGQPAASYDLRADQISDPKITVNVWSDGVQRGDDRTTADVGLELRNTGDQPIRVDREALALESFDQHGAPLPAARLVRIQAEKGSDVVAPRSASIFRLRFELAVPVAPSQVGALRFRWGVVRDGDDHYVQFTDFRREPEHVASATAVYYDPIFGFYDPFFYGAPYGYHLNYYVPVRRVIIDHRDRPRPRPRP